MTDNSYREFGFLQQPIKGDFLGIKILPLSDHQERLNWIEENINRDGFFYPPQQATYKVDPITNKNAEKIEKSEKPASIFKLLPSHKITVTNPTNDLNTTNSDDVLVINVLAYLFGTRLQFADWKFDARVPIKYTNDIVIMNSALFHFLEFVYDWWCDLTPINQLKYINILYVFTRTRSLQWKWEKFAHQYMVFDAIFNLHKELNSIQKNVSHRERFDILLDKYEMPNKEELVNQIYSTRNNLFHEAIWGENLFGFGPLDSNIQSLPLYLSALNSRLICSITDYKNEYSTSKWWTRQQFPFDRPK
jgi:hypothetical protein